MNLTPEQVKQAVRDAGGIVHGEVNIFFTNSDKLLAAVALLRSAGDGWISVDERLPKPWDDVLIFPRPTDYCCEGHVDHKGQWYYGEYGQNGGHENHRIKPTHWRPLPHPPVHEGGGNV